MRGVASVRAVSPNIRHRSTRHRVFPSPEQQMTKSMRTILGTAMLLVAAAFMPTAQANVYKITFDDPNLVNLYFPGDAFTDSGFMMFTEGDFGTVDVASGLGALAPSGNATQFYFQSNDGFLVLAQQSGQLFDLLGFSAAFVPLSPPSSLGTVMVAVGLDAGFNQLAGVAWQFASQSGGAYPFATYDDPLDFADFHDLTYVEFFACSLVGGQVCTAATNNDGQFAIDDIVVSTAAAVPEPASGALVLIALVALGASRSRKPRHPQL
jgi:hypothetical protein